MKLFQFAFLIPLIFKVYSYKSIEKVKPHAGLCDEECQKKLGLVDKTLLSPRATGQCGPKNDNVSCPKGQCCSKYGWCGVGDNYCGEGCQSKFGRCNSTDKGNTSKDTNNTENSSGIKVYEKCLNKNHWALTYDDGPYIYDEDLLDLLKELGVKATFFVNGKNVMNIKTKQGRNIIRRMYNEGHEIASHTYKHINLNTKSIDEITDNMKTLEEAINEIVGVRPAFVRPPYGAGASNSTVINTLKDLGYTSIIMWNVDTLDYDKSGDVDYALSQFKAKDGQPIISLNHCFYETITKERLLNLTKAEIEYMKRKGYKIVTMSECIGRKAYKQV